MKEKSFLGQVIAVISRRTSAFTPISGERSTFPGLILQIVRRHEANPPVASPVDTEDVHMPTAPPVGIGATDEGLKGSPWRSDQRLPTVVGRTTVVGRSDAAEPLLTATEIATMFRVDPKAVTRWAKAGKLTSIRTLGGHRRYRETEVRALLEGIPQEHTE